MKEQAQNLQACAEEARAHFSDPVLKKLCDAIASFAQAASGDAPAAPAPRRRAK